MGYYSAESTLPSKSFSYESSLRNHLKRGATPLYAESLKDAPQPTPSDLSDFHIVKAYTLGLPPVTLAKILDAFHRIGEKSASLPAHPNIHDPYIRLRKIPDENAARELLVSMDVWDSSLEKPLSHGFSRSAFIVSQTLKQPQGEANMTMGYLWSLIDEYKHRNYKRLHYKDAFVEATNYTTDKLIPVKKGHSIESWERLYPSLRQNPYAFFDHFTLSPAHAKIAS